MSARLVAEPQAQQDGLSLGEPGAHLLDDLPRRGHHSNDDERAAIHDRFSVNEHLILAVATGDRIHLGLQFPAKSRRHPDGVDSRDSEGAIANRHPGHRDPD